MKQAHSKSFKKSKAWITARHFAKHIWTITSKGPIKTDYGLADQMNLTVGFIMDNIAEGVSNNNREEARRYFNRAKSANEEVRSQLHRALDREHLDEKAFSEMLELSKETQEGIKRLIEETFEDLS